MEFKKQVLKTKVCASGQPPDSSTAQTACDRAQTERVLDRSHSSSRRTIQTKSTRKNRLHYHRRQPVAASIEKRARSRGQNRGRHGQGASPAPPQRRRPSRGPSGLTQRPKQPILTPRAKSSLPRQQDPPPSPLAPSSCPSRSLSRRAPTLHSNNTHLSAPPLLLPLPPATSRHGLASPRRLRHFRNTTSATAMVTATARPRRGPGPR